MTGPGAEALALVLLAGILGWAVVRPRGIPEAVPALAGAALLVALGALGSGDVGDRWEELAPTLALLAGLLVLGEGCARAGLFAWAGDRLAAGARGRPRRLLALTFAAAAACTAVLSLDATVVLLTPAVVAAATAARMRTTPHVFAAGHLANTASLLLPVSNLTNLLAFSAVGVSFAHFGALMALPWLAALAVEWVVLRLMFAADLRGPGREVPPPGPPPAFAVVVVLAALAGFAAASPLGVDPAWVAGLAAVVLAARVRLDPRALVAAAGPGLLLFVLGLAVVVDAAQRNGLGHQVAALVPAGAGLGALLLVAGLAAALANLANNLPATLILLPALHGTGPVLAALVGLGVGPNLTYTGSLATVLWRRVLRDEAAEPGFGQFLRLGVLTVPPTLVLATIGLWLSLRF